MAWVIHKKSIKQAKLLQKAPIHSSELFSHIQAIKPFAKIFVTFVSYITKCFVLHKDLEHRPLLF